MRNDIPLCVARDLGESRLPRPRGKDSFGERQMKERPIIGWMAWKGRSPYDPCVTRTKRDMLCGYDMMPLRGLHKTEQFLASSGITLVRTEVAQCTRRQRAGFALARNGRILLDSLAWPVSHSGGGAWEVADSRGVESLCRWSSYYFVASSMANELTPVEVASLYMAHGIDRSYADPIKAKDRRRQSTLDMKCREADEAMARLGIELVPVAFRRIDADQQKGLPQ